jgi:succinyl-diaminopimelate desuccinylase
LNPDTLLQAIDSSRDFAIELQRGLVAIPAVCPASGGEGELDKAVWLQEQLRRLGLADLTRCDAPDPAAKGGVQPNLIARLPGSDRTRTLWLMSHLDIVPPGDLSAWRTDPYTLHVDDGRLVGRGVEDNHQAIVASILVARAFLELGTPPPVDLALLFCADEETGSAYGARFLAREHADLFRPHDAFVVPDAGNAEGTLLEVAEKSIWWLKVRTSGKQCHAASPERGVNAFRAASELVFRLGSLQETFPQRDELFDPPISTFEPTKKEANVPNINTVPGDDVFYLDARVLPAVPLADVEAEIRRLAAEVEAAHGVAIAFENVQREEAAPPTSPDADVVRLIAGAVARVYGVTAKPQGIGGGTVAAVFRQLGLPAAVYSRLDESAHQPNEYCLLDNLIGDAKVFALAALGMGR